MDNVCPECGTVWQEGQTCLDHFYQMLYWEAEYPAYGAVHHLMVLCYHLQHPSLYSAEGLHYAAQLLMDFVERGMTPQEARQRNRAEVDSGNRTWKVTAAAESKGTYAHPVQWTMTAADVTGDDVHHYTDNVRAWARSVYESLESSDNLG